MGVQGNKIRMKGVEEFERRLVSEARYGNRKCLVEAQTD